MHQQTPLKYHPVKGGPVTARIAITAADARKASDDPWVYNPWTSEARDPTDVVSDPHGHTIIPPGETVMSAMRTQVGGGHYKDMAIQPVEYIHRNGLGFTEGSVVKYVSRWRAKGGVEDLKKARHFLDLLIEMEGSPASK